MLNDEAFHGWCERLGLSEAARAIIGHIRSSPPARRVQSRAGNVSGRHASWKMGVTLQFESRHIERPAIYEMEYDDDICEFYDQPSTFLIEYTINGKNKRHPHTPDFFVIRKNGAGWEEWKPENQLMRLADKYPERYNRTDAGRWRCPPGERYAEQYGLYYRLRSSAELNPVLQRNLEMLEAYFRHPPPIPRHAREAILSLVESEPGVTLEAVLHRLRERVSRDDVYALMAADEVYMDLHVAWLGEPDRVRLFQTKEQAQTYHFLDQPSALTPATRPKFIDVRVGASVLLGNEAYTILYAGQSIGLLGSSGNVLELLSTAFEDLVRHGQLTGLSLPAESPDKKRALELYKRAGPQELKEAQRRYDIIQQYRNKNPVNPAGVTKRTICRWLVKYREAEAKYSIGFLGLIPGWPARGNRRPRLDEKTRALMLEFIEKEYETVKQKRMISVYGAFALECDVRGLITPTYKAFARAVHRRPGYEQVKKRQGHRAAYAEKPFYWQLDEKTPPHGDRPFQIGHIDHTELDIELICSRTGRNLGRPWATLLVDAYSRRILAVYLTYNPPSYQSCMMILRACVQRHQRFPESIVVDGGKEFESTYFEVLLAQYECSKLQRPPAESRFGSLIERIFGTTNTQFIYNLSGNTQLTRNVRQVTKAVNPKNHALWTLGDLYELFCQWAYEHYDTRTHPALGQSPRQAFTTGMALYGRRNHRLISYDQEFLLYTMPSTAKGTAKVVPGKGVKINYLFYWSNAFRDPEMEGTAVPVRYDPFDASRAYAYVQHGWVECLSEHSAQFHGHSEKVLKMVTAELRQQKKAHTRQLPTHAKDIARFMAAAEKKEALQLQLLKDQEAKGLYGDPPSTQASKDDRSPSEGPSIHDDHYVEASVGPSAKEIGPDDFEPLEEF